MNSIIFYGAGRNAEANYDRWINSGLIPVCFADSDKEKHNRIFMGHEVLPLEEAIYLHPNYTLYCTQVAHNFVRIKDYLLQKGIPENRVKLLDGNQIAKNALSQYTYLLCDAFSDIIDKLIEMGEYKRLNPEMLASDIFQCFQLFITQQTKIQMVYERLNYNSKQVWYSMIYLWIVTQLFLEDPVDIQYTHEKRYNDFKLIQSIVPGVWDLDSEKVVSTLREQYLNDEDLIRCGDNIIDAGAYTGDTAEVFSKIVNNGKVFAFEPFI